MKLKYVARLIAGGTPDTTDADMWSAEGTGTPWVAIGDMSGRRIVRSTARSLSPEGLSSRRIVPSAPGTVLFAMYASVGEVATLGVPAVWNQAILGVVPIEGRAEGRFVAYWLRHFAGEARSRANAATQANLGADQVANFPFAGFSLDEQRRIADFLDDRVARIDQIITARQSQVSLNLLMERRRIMDELLEDSLSMLPTHPWFVSQEGGLRILPLGKTWNVIDCKHRTPSYVESGYPVVSPGDVRPGRLDLTVPTRFVDARDFADLADGPRRCLPGDIVYSRNASAGIAAYVDNNAPFTMGQDVCRITSASASQLYLSYVLNFLVEPQLEAARVGSTFTRINIAQIKAMNVPVPSQARQNIVSRACDSISAAAVSTRQSLLQSARLLGEYKQSLITAAVTGEFDVTAASTRVPGE